MPMIVNHTPAYYGGIFDRCPRTYRELIIPMQAAGILSDGHTNLAIALDFAARAEKLLGRNVTVYEDAETVIDEIERRLGGAHTSHTENHGNG